MKVLYDHQCFVQQQFGGVSRYHYQLIKELSRLQKVEVELSLKYSNNFYINEDKSFEVRKFFPKTKFYFKRTILDYLNRISTRQKLELGGYDIFHPTYYNPYFLDHLSNKPFIITVYDSIHEKYPEIINSIDRTLENKKLLLSKAGSILAISNSTKNDLIQRYNIPSEKIEVVYLAASINKQIALPKGKLNLPKNIFYLLVTEISIKTSKTLFLHLNPCLKNIKIYF